MLKSCRYCGRVHPAGFVCKASPKKAPRASVTRADRFRWSEAWKRRRAVIRQRDLDFCRVCLAQGRAMPGGTGGCAVQVHHIEPLEERYDLRLAEDNLITLCPMHHKQAETGDISRDILHSLTGIPPVMGGPALPIFPQRR